MLFSRLRGGADPTRSAEHRPNEFFSIEHLGVVKNGVEDTSSDEVKKWAGAHEGARVPEGVGGESRRRWIAGPERAGDLCRRSDVIERRVHHMREMAGIAVVAAAATLGDFIWYTVGVSHTITAGILHGALLLATVGAAIGATSGRMVKGLPIGAIAGVGGAFSYYLLILVVDRRTYGTAIPGAWVIMWLLLAALEGRWLRGAARRPWGEIALRGGIAAVAGGLAFVLVRNTLWGEPPAGGGSYFVQFAAWAFAWAPGLLTLTWGNTGRRADHGPAHQAAVRNAGEPHPVHPSTTTTGSSTAATSITALDLRTRIDRGERLHILDVRSKREFAAGHVPGAVNMPFGRILSGMDPVPMPTGQELLVYCGHGPRAYIAALALRSRGYRRIVYLSGHFAGWRAAGFRIER
jgi:rhodanese-related sulfurtransferase